MRSALVVGAGDDPYRALVPAQARYVTVDIDPGSPELSVLGDAHDLPVRTSAFDCIVASEVLEHLPSPQHFVAEARRALTPGGTLIATVPFLFHVHADPDDYARYTASGLRRLFERFASVEVVPVGGRLSVTWDLVTTGFAPRPVLAPLRVLSHVVRLVPQQRRSSSSTAPSGYLVVASA